MKNKFWCVLKVFLTDITKSILDKMKENWDEMKFVSIALLTALILSWILCWINENFPIVFLFAALIELFLGCIAGVYLFFIEMKRKWNKAKEECWDILGDNK